MENFSQIQLANYAKIIASLVVLILAIFKVTVDEGQVAFILLSVFTLAASAYSFYQRYKKGDLTLGGVRK